MSVAITAENVSKRFLRGGNRTRTLRESVHNWFTGRPSEKSVFWALRDISFTVERGEVFGIIGHNGAGKSTLLRLLCGLGHPTSGKVVRNGVVSGILELGGGFHPDLTGRQNIVTVGILNGLSRAEVHAREKDIIAFAEMEEFIDQPVRTYSNGMYLRLAFAAATEFDPAVLVLDEVLAVGDEHFQQKCLERIAGFRRAGKTLIITSHDASQMQTLCDQILVLEDGQIVMQSDPKSALACYHDLISKRTARRIATLLGATAAEALFANNGGRQGTQEATISAVRLFDTKGNETNKLQSGEGLVVELDIHLSSSVEDAACTVGIFNNQYMKCFESGLPSVQAILGSAAGARTIRCELKSLPLLGGTYYLNIGLYSTDWSYQYDFHRMMYPLHIKSVVDPRVYATGVLAVESVWNSHG